MTLHLGKVKPGSTIYIPFDTFAGATGASVTMSGLAVTDIEIYKNGSTTQRASDTGYTLLDTDGIDFDALTGVHGFSIDLSSNADAGFFVAGGFYWVVVSAITIDSQTVSFVAATFTIGYEGAILDTTIATLSTQTSFTLTAGPAEDDALNGCEVAIHDIASAVQVGRAIISDYTGSTKTVTLVAGVTFTAAAGDNISVFLSAVQPTVQGRTLDVSTGGEAGVDWANVGTPGSTVGLSATTVATVTTTTTATNVTTVNGLAAGVITAAAIATGAIDADAVAADAVAEIADGVWDEDATAHQTQGTFGQAIGDPAADTDTIYALANTIAGNIGTPSNLGGGATISANLSDIEGQTDDIGAAGAGLTALATQASVNTIDDFLDTEVAAIITTLGTPAGASLAADIAAIEAQTDDIGAAGAGLTAVPWNAAWDAEVQSEVTDALVAASLDKLILATGTADSGSTTTMVDAARTEADADYWKGRLIVFTSGNIAGQCAIVTDFNAGTDTFTFAPALTQAVATQTYIILPGVSAWDDTIAEHLTAGTTGASLNAATAPTAAAVADAVWDETLSGHLGVGSTGEALNAAGAAGDPWTTALPGAYGSGSAGHIIGNRLVGTIATGTHNPQSGDAYARLGAPAGASVSADIADVEGKVDDLETRLGTPSDLGSGATVAGNLVDIEAQTDDIGIAGAGLTALASAANLSTLAGYVDTEVAAIKAKTDNLPTDPADQSAVEAAITAATSALALQASVDSLEAGVIVTTNNDKTGYALSTAGVDAILDDVVLGSYTLRQLVRGLAAANLGKLSGAATTTITIRSADDTKNVIVATVDADGNRSAVTLDLT